MNNYKTFDLLSEAIAKIKRGDINLSTDQRGRNIKLWAVEQFTDSEYRTVRWGSTYAYYDPMKRQPILPARKYYDPGTIKSSKISSKREKAFAKIYENKIDSGLEHEHGPVVITPTGRIYPGDVEKRINNEFTPVLFWIYTPPNTSNELECVKSIFAKRSYHSIGRGFHIKINNVIEDSEKKGVSHAAPWAEKLWSNNSDMDDHYFQNIFNSYAYEISMGDAPFMNKEGKIFPDLRFGVKSFGTLYLEDGIQSVMFWLRAQKLLTEAGLGDCLQLKLVDSSSIHYTDIKKSLQGRFADLCMQFNANPLNDIHYHLKGSGIPFKQKLIEFNKDIDNYVPYF